MTTDLQDSDDQKIDEVPFKIDGMKALRSAFTDKFKGIWRTPRLSHTWNMEAGSTNSF